MRVILGTLLAASVLLLAFWAYQENYRTRWALAETRQVQMDIARLQEELGVLRAEWAYLNRPERLRALVELNFERLGLLAMSPDHFGYVDQIAYPPSPNRFLSGLAPQVALPGPPAPNPTPVAVQEP
ncbi:MAG: cell division protein FtsL [Pseudomonadota bacterium]